MKVACTVLNGESGSNAADLHNSIFIKTQLVFIENVKTKTNLSLHKKLK